MMLRASGVTTNGRVPPAWVLIYSFGDDMYRKVQASALQGVHHFCGVFRPSGPQVSQRILTDFLGHLAFQSFLGLANH